MKKIIILLIATLYLFAQNNIVKIQNLMWEDDINVQTKKYTYEEAKNYCKNLTLGSYNDWRIPTIKELLLIVDYNKYKPAIAAKFTYCDKYSKYWTKTPLQNEDNEYWAIDFYRGRTTYVKKNKKIFVRCVRNNTLSDYKTNSKIKKQIKNKTEKKHNKQIHQTTTGKKQTNNNIKQSDGCIPFTIKDSDIKIVDATKKKLSKEEMIKLLKNMGYPKYWWADLLYVNGKQYVSLYYYDAMYGRIDFLSIHNIKIPVDAIDKICKNGVIVFNKKVILTETKTDPEMKAELRNPYQEIKKFDFIKLTGYKKELLFKKLAPIILVLKEGKFKGTIFKKDIYKQKKHTLYIKLSQYQPMCPSYQITLAMSDAYLLYKQKKMTADRYLKYINKFKCIPAFNSKYRKAFPYKKGFLIKSDNMPNYYVDKQFVLDVKNK